MSVFVVTWNKEGAAYGGVRRARLGRRKTVSMLLSDAFVFSDFSAAVATTTQLTGQTSGAVGIASTNFTVAANGTIAGDLVVTPNDNSGGGTFAPASVTINTASPTATFKYTPGSAGAKTIALTNNGGLANQTATTYTASNSVLIAPNNPAIVYSPANWTGATAVSNKSINAGAYFKTNFTGAACTMTFGMTNMGAMSSQIAYRIDGKNWVRQALAASVVCTMPTDTSAAPYHTLEVVIKSISETLACWATTSATAVVFTGLVLDAGASVLAPITLPYSIIKYGDSITEGVRTINSTATNDTDRNDALTGYALDLGYRLGVEVGIVGFGSQG